MGATRAGDRRDAPVFDQGICSTPPVGITYSVDHITVREIGGRMADDDGTPDVTVVNVDAGGDDSGTTPAVVIPDQSDPWPTIAAHGERLVACEGGLTALAARIDELDGRIVSAQITADVAADQANAAVDIAVDAAVEVDALAVETEEAVAAVAEEADAATAEVVEEVEEIAPSRDHPWFKQRKFMKAES